MKVGFIGTGRMGGAMVRRLLEAKHEVGVYNRTAEKAKPLADAGAKIVARSPTPRATATSSTPCWPTTPRWKTSCSSRACSTSLPKGGIHVCAGTHGIPVIRKIKAGPRRQGAVLVAAPMMGRPELVAAGTAGVFASGPAEAMAKCKPLFEAHRPQHLRGRRRSGGRHRHEDRQQLRARLRHRGDGRRLRADAQIRRRHAACSTT